VRTVGITDRADFTGPLHAVFVNRRDQAARSRPRPHIFWRNPQLLEKMLSLVCPSSAPPTAEGGGDDPPPRRGDASGQAPSGLDETGEEKVEIDATMTFSERELLREMDFEKMSLDELARAKSAISACGLPEMAVPTQRFRPDPAGRGPICVRRFEPPCARAASLPCAASAGARGRRRLSSSCDISGSMNRYVTSVVTAA